MSSISDKDRLKMYGTENPTDIFTQIDKGCDSYWIDKPDSTAFGEYGFDSVSEMMEQLSEYIEDKELCQIIAAASFKRKKMYSIAKENKADAEEKEELPEFVYVF